MKNSNKKDFVWLPVEYENEARPGVLLYDDQSLYKKDLAKYFMQPVHEGFVIISVGKTIKAFLAQVAYDPFALAKNNNKLQKSNFTGTLLKSDWGDNLISGTIYQNGRIVRGFKNEASPVIEESARTEGCDMQLVSSYTSWYVDGDGVFTIVAHNTWNVICDGSGGGFDGGYDPGNGGGNGGGGYYDPLLGSGAGSEYPTSYFQDYNVTNALRYPGEDRTQFNKSLANRQALLGLSYDMTSWSFDKADALSRSVGLNLEKAFPLIYITTKVVGILQAFAGVYDIYIILKDGDLSKEEIPEFVAGVAGIGAAAFGGWVAVAFGAVSIGVAVYEQTTN